MVIEGFVDEPGQIAQRVGLIGTCRVRTWINFACFDVGTVNNFPPNIKVHGPGHAKQLLDWSRGAWRPPEIFLHFVCGDEPLNDEFIEQCSQDLEAADTVLIEVSELDELVCEGVYLQPNYFFQHFMQARKHTVLDWYFALTTGEGDLDAAREVALENLRQQPGGMSELEERIVRGTRLDGKSQADLEAVMSATMYDHDKRWLWQPLFLLPGESILNERRVVMRDMLREATRNTGCELVDISPVVEALTAAIALDKHGQDPNHFSYEGGAVIGQALVDIVRRRIAPDDFKAMIKKIPAYREKSCRLMSDYISWLWASGKVT